MKSNKFAFAYISARVPISSESSSPQQQPGKKLLKLATVDLANLCMVELCSSAPASLIVAAPGEGCMNNGAEAVQQKSANEQGEGLKFAISQFG